LIKSGNTSDQPDELLCTRIAPKIADYTEKHMVYPYRFQLPS
jgi:hypothetical protein